MIAVHLKGEPRFRAMEKGVDSINNSLTAAPIRARAAQDRST
jgi:hypothetical protein